VERFQAGSNSQRGPGQQESAKTHKPLFIQRRKAEEMMSSIIALKCDGAEHTYAV